MRLSPLLLSLALLVPAAPAFAASAAKVDELIVELKIEQNFVQMQQIMADSFEQGFQQSVKQRGLSEAQVARARPQIDAMKKMVAEGMSWAAMADDFRKIYAEELTDAEVDAALAYYRSPEGASMMAKMPVLMQRGAEVGQRRAAELMPKMMQQMQQTVDAAATAK